MQALLEHFAQPPPPDTSDPKHGIYGCDCADYEARLKKLTKGAGKKDIQLSIGKIHKETQQSDVDARWLAEAGARLGKIGTPRFPLVVGGAGMTGSNMCVLLANTPGVERIRVLDRAPVRKAVLTDCPALEKKLDYVQHYLCHDSEEELMVAFEGIDCVFSIITPHVQLATAECFYETNVEGVKLMLNAASSKGVPRFVFLSSIAVTNHFLDSKNQSEDDPLPEVDSLESPYDRSKQIGEKLVLEANGKNGMATCALRAGGILLTPWDYTFRNYLMIPGLLLGIANVGDIDWIAGQDVARALVLAAKAMEARPKDVNGEAFFLTKGETAPPSTLMYTCAEFFGWPTIDLPEPLFELGCILQQVFHEVKSKLRLGGLPGVPPHKFWKLGRIYQTFNNDKIQKAIGYTPEVTLRQAIWHICACHQRDMEAKGSLDYIKPVKHVANGYLFIAKHYFWFGLVLFIGLLRWLLIWRASLMERMKLSEAAR